MKTDHSSAQGTDEIASERSVAARRQLRSEFSLTAG